MLVRNDEDAPFRSFSRFTDTQLSEEAMRLVRQDVGETPESRSRGLAILKNMLSETRDLRACPDDEFLLRFLRVSKFDCARAHERLLRYYGLRRKYPHIFRKYLPSETRRAQQLRLFHAAPLRAPNHSAVVLNCHGLLNPSKVSIEEKFCLDMLAVERALGNPLNQLCGAHVLLDFKEFNLWKMLAMTPQVVRMYVEFLQNSFPLRLKSIICLNTPTVFSILFNMIYPLLSKKLRSRLMVHSVNEGWESLHAVLPPEILPEAYGGKVKKSSLIDLCEKIEDQEDYFRRHLDYGFSKARHHHD